MWLMFVRWKYKGNEEEAGHARREYGKRCEQKSNTKKLNTMMQVRILGLVIFLKEAVLGPNNLKCFPFYRTETQKHKWALREQPVHPSVSPICCIVNLSKDTGQASVPSAVFNVYCLLLTFPNVQHTWSSHSLIGNGLVLGNKLRLHYTR